MNNYDTWDGLQRPPISVRERLGELWRGYRNGMAIIGTILVIVEILKVVLQ